MQLATKKIDYFIVKIIDLHYLTMTFIIPTNQSATCLVTLDDNGNLYFTRNDNKTYQIDIDKHNNPKAEYANYDIIEQVNVDLSFASEQNVIPEDMLNEIMNDDDQAEQTAEEQMLMYFPEKYNTLMNNYKNCEFVFHKIDDTIQVHKRNNGHISALYDTLVFKDDRLIFESINVKDHSIYVIKVCNNGTVIFRQIGDPEKYYKISVDGDELLFVLQ